MDMSTQPTPSEEEVEEVLECCRYGELPEVQAFVEKYSWEAVSKARDERGNTILHMCCGNGHLEVLNYLLPHLQPSLLQETNEAGSPALHWAILNNHTTIVQTLVDLPEERGGGIKLLKQTNRSGRDAFAEALFGGEGKEEVAGWIEGYLWKVEGGEEGPEGEENGPVEVTEDVVAKDEAHPASQEGEGEVKEEIQDITQRAEKVELRW